MKEHPILFTGAMVRAILEGRKTQTRRPIKPQPPASWQPTVGNFHPTKVDRKGVEFPGEAVFGASDETFGCRAPFAVGDRLWVRETWGHLLVTEEHHYVAGGDLQCRERTRLVTAEDLEDWDGGPPSVIAYKASHADEEIKSWGVHRETWRPSIHMPRWASRITLEVTAIRPERVQSISEADAIAEGADAALTAGDDPERAINHRSGFRELWDGIYGKGPLAWANNPWVWATTFRRIEAGK